MLHRYRFSLNAIGSRVATCVSQFLSETAQLDAITRGVSFAIFSGASRNTNYEFRRMKYSRITNEAPFECQFRFSKMSSCFREGKLEGKE